MARIEPLSPPYSAEVQAHFDAVMPPGAPPLLLFRTLATSERAWRKLLGGSLLDPGPLGIREREILIDRTCSLSGCEYEWGVHVALFAEKAGLTSEQIAATVHGSADAPCWTEAEQALIAAADALYYRAGLDGAEFEALRSYYANAQILEMIQLCGFYRTIACLVRSLDLPLEPDGARFPVQPPQQSIA